MSTGGEGVLTLTVKMRVSPEPDSFKELVSLMKGAWMLLTAL